MSALEWKPAAHRYSIHALDYSVCKVCSATGWTYECWKGREQLKVGLLSANAARTWCQRHHDEHTGEIHAADSESPAVLAGQ